MAALIERLLPIARETGDEPFLSPFQPIDRFETGSALQRRLYRESGSWEALLDRLACQLAGELDAASAPSVAPNSATPACEDADQGVPLTGSA